ncbi:Potassium-transporting ATPase B chain [Paramagnetospirillum magnetotacticum MS-1]|uniref:Potassium-transporting ATPase ATP-binding subunit n=1 Tax=Paramagnetospirillum magnetotacticum MS-1 TaxID=272627 RepID=A0A0C2YHW2_PARME|nr:potassium-transporting ATPase subunit KdpB [Paramagnetospirillum magnetotacticum]KIL99349.1 Potassium-transporting ATPase B chain [Paramagnetospirillum magnetotacticum MS-1]
MTIHRPQALSLLDGPILAQAGRDAVTKLDPRQLVRNPIMFATALVSVASTILTLRDAASGAAQVAVMAQISAWLWFTVLFANFAEAIAEGRGKAQAASLRRTKSEAMARKVASLEGENPVTVPAASLKAGDLVVCETGDVIPGDGDVAAGIATVDESAITGESAPVIRESGGDRSAVTGGTRVVSDRIIVRITANPGESFLDRMITLVEGAKRQKTPNEIALTILLVGMTLIFLVVVASLPAWASWSGTAIPVVFLAALFITLIPTTIGGLLSAIGIAGMDRLVKFNVIAKSGRAVEAAGDIDVLLLDKTGTITLGARQASEFLALPGISEHDLAEAAFLSSLADETPEGKSIVALARLRFQFAEPDMTAMTFVPFTAQTRMSGVDAGACRIRKGASDAILKHVADAAPRELVPLVERVAKAGGTPLVVARNGRALGVIHLKDIIKPGIRERFLTLRAMGIRTVMITGDNPLTAAAIAAEAGVDDFLAEATPERKLELIREHQQGGKLVAMCGDGSNDAPALAQADVGVAMNTGTQAAREAGNMVDLESDPTKLIEIVMIGKQLLMSRGALTTFSIANDVAKYFAIIPALFLASYPQLQALNIMGLTSPQSAILSAIIFNALIIIALIPLALKGVRYRPADAETLLKRNLLVYGLGGLVVPFAGIKLIDMAVAALHLA